MSAAYNEFTTLMHTASRLFNAKSEIHLYTPLLVSVKPQHARFHRMTSIP